MFTNSELDMIIDALDSWKGPHGHRKKMNLSMEQQQKKSMRERDTMLKRFETLRSERNNTCNHGTMFA